MGFSDIGCYGSEIPTPNLDKLAADGLRFTQFYNTGRCCPTRAVAAHRALLPPGRRRPHDRGPRRCPATAAGSTTSASPSPRCCGRAGYFTAMTGKWHVGQKHGVVPWNRGFDRSLNCAGRRVLLRRRPQGRRCSSTASKLDPRRPRAAQGLVHHRPLDRLRHQVHRRGARRRRSRSSSTSPTTPRTSRCRRRRRRSPSSAASTRSAGTSSASSATPGRSSWASSTRPGRFRRAPTRSRRGTTSRPSSRTASTTSWRSTPPCVAHMDTAVGRLVDAPEAARRARQHADPVHERQRRQRRERPRRQARRRPARRARRRRSSKASPGPRSPTRRFRRYKHFNHEGGIATPLIVHWPARIKTPGRAAAAARPRDRHHADLRGRGRRDLPDRVQRQADPADGRPQPACRPSTNKPIEREALFWEHEGNAAVRAGDWKLVRFGRNGPWELYDLKADRTELHDLAAAEPARAKELAAQWEAWAKRAHVEPGPAAGPGKAKKAGGAGD